MDKRVLAILAAFGASLIYGINHTVAKDAMPTYIQPFGFILLRVLGATILFWIIGIWGPKERIQKTDFLRVFFCALTGMCINMLAFFKGLSLSSPINSSVIITLSPIVVFVLSALLIKEKITWVRWFGIALGFAGALALVLFGNVPEKYANNNALLGNSLMILNSIAYSMYLIAVKPLTAKYHPFTLMKWIFLLSIFINLPITYKEFVAVDWFHLPFDGIWKLSFVVLGTTFLTYLLNLFALKQLKASTIGAFVYLQPLIGIIFATMVGADTLSTTKISAALLVFTGVYLVTKKPKANPA
ncbi:DMT family transporter [Zhouia sp. PK063]|uniref:DMT family transporter n=1 Tax=Zhouia sp. PK063 TaxID=3373602 RepID=UPI0037986622